jgi:hypothetical protein
MRMIRAQAAALLAISIAGAAVAVRTDTAGLVVLFGLVGAIAVATLRPEKRGRPVHLRPDLARWLEYVAALTAEPVDDVLDRSVSAYRASMRRGPDG